MRLHGVGSRNLADGQVPTIGLKCILFLHWTSRVPNFKNLIYLNPGSFHQQHSSSAKVHGSPLTEWSASQIHPSTSQNSLKVVRLASLVLKSIPISLEIRTSDKSGRLVKRQVNWSCWLGLKKLTSKPCLNSHIPT